MLYFKYYFHVCQTSSTSIGRFTSVIDEPINVTMLIIKHLATRSSYLIKRRNKNESDNKNYNIKNFDSP